MIRLVELLSIIDREIDLIITDEDDNHYTRDNLPLELIGRLVQIILPYDDILEILLFPKEEYMWMETPNGDILTYYTDGDTSEYDIIRDIERGNFIN